MIKSAALATATGRCIVGGARGTHAMASGIHDLDTLPPAHLDPDAAKFYEVVDGQIVENSPPGARQSILASYLQVLMGTVARSERLGRVVSETLFLLDGGRVLKRRPDIAFVSAERWSLKHQCLTRKLGTSCLI